MNRIKPLTNLAILLLCVSAHSGVLTNIDPTSPHTDLGGVVLSVAYLSDGAAVMNSDRGLVYRRNSANDPWERISVDIDGEEIAIRRLVTLPGVSSQILASSNTRLLRSTDSGATWSDVNVVVGDDFNLDLRSLSPSSNANVVYAAFRSPVDPFGDANYVGRSDDGGATWLVTANPTGTEGYSHSIKYIDSSSPDSNSLLAVTQNSGVYLSRDAGITWFALVANVGAGDIEVTDAAFGTGDANTLFARRSGRIYYSDDSGTTWSQSNNLGLITVTGMTPDATQPNAVYAYGRGLFRYDATGNSAVTYAWGNIQDTINETAVSATGEVITGSRRGIRTVEGAASTVPSNVGFADFNFDKIVAAPSNGDYLYGLDGYGGVAAYDPASQNWTLRNEGLEGNFKRDIAVSHSDPSRVMVASSNGLYSTSQAGVLWQDSTPQLASRSYQNVVYSPLNDLTIFAESRTNGVLRSLDGSTSWSVLLDASVNGGCCLELITAVSAVNDQYVIKTSPQGPVPAYVSTDGGDSWNPLNWPTAFEGRTAQAVHFDQESADTVRLVFTSAVATTNDLGNSWSITDVVPPPGTDFSFFVAASVVDPLEPTRLYLAAPNVGLFVFDTRDGSTSSLAALSETTCFTCNTTAVSMSADQVTAGRLLVGHRGRLYEFFDDRDDDGLLDYADNCAAVDNNDQTDTDADGIGNACDADIAPSTNDCTVNFLDLQAFASAFLSDPTASNWNADADFNHDLVVNFLDFTTLTDSFLNAPGPSGLDNSCR